MAERDDSPAAVAIVGLGCRLPGGIHSLTGLWDALREERDLVGTVPADRFDSARFVAGHPARPGKSYTAAGGFLDDVAEFDADYFGISPKEAAHLDPQQRLVLECAAEALDDAGIAPDALAGGDTAVLMGVSSNDYWELQLRRPRAFNAYTMSGVASCNVANRVSYAFDLHGSSTAVDTACSSALVAVHQACEALRSGRSATALAGGVNLLLDPNGFAGFSQASMLSPTGRCRPFSSHADGFTRAEAAGVLVLKPLAAALADGDRVHAVILASGTNTDGRTAGLALPDAKSQAALLAQVYAEAGVGPDEVAYVEAHGTGTQAGDPIECAALGEVLGRRGAGAGRLPIGSVKSNLGHSESAAGVAGLLKAVLVLRERRIPATLHLDELREEIDFAGLGLEPVAHIRPLTGPGRGVVGVSGFGFGGVNAHVVLAAPPPSPRSAAGTGTRLPVVVSARTPQALAEAARNWADHLEGVATEDFYDTAFTADRRGKHERRAAVVAADPREAADALRTLAGGEPVRGGASATAVRRGRIGFVFDGNGSQWAGMGRELLSADRAFRAEVVAVDEVLTPLLGWSALDELAEPDAPRWRRTEIAQPVLFAVQAGLVAALAARGMRPAAVVGHSVGEVAAAHCAGALDRVAACRVIAARSRAQAATAGTGRMAAVGLGEQDAERLLADTGHAGQLAIAAVNSPRDVTVSGHAHALAALGEEARGRGVFFRDLELDYPFHSPVMDSLRGGLTDALTGLRTADCRIPLVSTVTGAPVDGADLDAGYWWRNVRLPVRFADAVRVLVGQQGCDVLVEVGPHPALGTYLRRVAADSADPVALVPTTTRTMSGPDALDLAQAHALAAGGEVDRDAFFPRRGRVVDLPAYPWQRERHWNGHPDWWLPGTTQDTAAPVHPLLGSRQPGPEPVWSQDVEPGPLGWLADHRVGRAVVLPASAHVDLALAAGREVLDAPVEVTGLVIDRALTLPWDDPDSTVRLHTALGRDARFSVAARVGEHGDWVEHARARVRRLLSDAPPPLDVAAVTDRLPRTITAEQHYAACARAGLPYGPAFRVLTGLRVGDGEVLAAYSAAVEPDDRHPAHPTVLDGALQAGLSLIAEPVAHLPVGIDAVRFRRPMPAVGLVHLSTRTADARQISWDMTITDPDGVVALEVVGCRAHRFEGARPPRPARLVEVLRAAPLPDTPAEASPLPCPHAVLAGCEPDLAALADRWREHPYGEVRRRTAQLAGHFTAAALRELLPAADTVTFPALAAAGVLPGHRLLLTALIDSAVGHGLLTEAGEGRWGWGCEPEPHRLFRAALRALPAESISLQGYGVCGLHLAAVLRGERDPLDLLFAEPDNLATRFYDSVPAIHHHNRVAARLLRALVENWPADRPLRVLEVGAGTGGLTASLLPLLPAGRTRYTYTDISPAFFSQAEERFGGFGFLDHRVLDLNADPAEQGFTPGSFDLVVAANVLHATRDLARSLHRVADLLADGGQLLAVEIHNASLFAPVFGLLGSFWDNEDTDLRPDGPLVAREDWPPLLADRGFTSAVQAGDLAHGDYSVILAARDSRPAPVAGSTDTRSTDVPPPDVPATRWLVGRMPGAAPAGGLAPELVAALRDRFGHAVVHPVPVDDDTGRWTALLSREPGPVDVLLVVDAQATDAPADSSAADATERAVRHCAVLRALATASTEVTGRSGVTLWLVVPAAEGGGQCAPATPGAAAWGAARSLANEHPGLTVRRIALAGHAADDAGSLVTGLVREALARPEDDEVLLTRAGRFVPRLRPPIPPTHPSSGRGADTRYTLTLSQPGSRYRLGWRPVAPPVARRGEVVVEVEAAALNYRDVLLATGLVPASRRDEWSEAVDIGGECAGVVTAVGPDVGQRAPGDRVACVTMGSFGSHVVVRAEHTLPVPAGTTCAEAVTLPLVALTVHHALHRLARLSAGETVLVHGAAGGVGLAALQYARHVGAHVIATAGTPAKRDLLHLLGVEHVLDSRSLHFADQVRTLTHGRGVDVVLNSLAGEAQIRSLGLLAPHGRFLELGKRDFLADASLPQAPFIDNLAFFGVDLTVLYTQPAPLAEAVAELDEAVRAGTYRPLPHRSHPASRVEEAFRSLQHSRHVGKVVVDFGDPVPVDRPTTPRDLDADAAYLVTGGLSGFGAATARHLATRGARHLVLIGRRGARTPGADELLADLRALGAHVEAHAADAADPEAVRRVLTDLDATGRRLAGVVHAAMVLHDAPLTDLTDDHLRAVLTPKLTAGLLLDRLTRHRDLDFFVVYSSAASCLGNIRQAPYAAANAALEALVRDRRRAGLPGLAVQWGGIGDTGYVHRTGRVDELVAVGIGALPAEDALHVLDELLELPDAVVAVGHFDWERLSRILPALAAPRTAALLSAQDDTPSAERLRDTLVAATDAEALVLVEDALADLLAKVLQTTPDRIDRTRHLNQLGVDSLMAAELATLVHRRFDCEIPAVELAGAPGLTALAHRIRARLGSATAPTDIPSQRPTGEDRSPVGDVPPAEVR
ncbi:SDR family NAD(P)-dependent oxidoreductase [Saccharothrix xinjiangensis]|uniref:SDR family NAD(P)-dependent oxidoreductase n=1 Tax=Saccharothrix xinjiangensis TaxID=204798 RepID=A0ABV9Y343_9PSEU